MSDNIASGLLLNRRFVTFRYLSLAVASALSIELSFPAIGQSYPNRAVRIVVPIAPGGTTDILVRLMGREMSQSLGQPFVIDNRAGASGIIGTELVAKANPDGYTLLSTTGTHTINPALYTRLPYDAVADFTPVALLASSPMVAVVHPSVPARNIRELIALAKRSVHPLNYGSAGAGTPSHLVVELFRYMAGVPLNHVPYKGGGPSLSDVASGQIELKVTAVLPAVSMVNAGRVRALGVTSLTRVTALAQVPTIAEAGVPGFEFGLWYVILGPARMSTEVVGVLNNEIRKALMVSSVKNNIEADGGQVIAATPSQTAEHIQKELKRYQQLITSAGIKPVER